MIFDDNYPVGAGSHRSLEQALSSKDYTTEYLEAVIESYQVFPPILAHDELVTAEKVKIGIPPLNLPYQESYRIFAEQMTSYRWMTYVRLRENPNLSLRMRLMELRNRRL